MKCRLQQSSCGCTLRQDPQSATVQADMPQDYETAFTICHRNHKELARGTGGAGGQYAVSLDIGCPDGFHPLGIWHSHPKGQAIPSDADESEMRKLGLENLCISVPQTGELRCYRVTRK